MRAWVPFLFALLVVESYRLAGSPESESEWFYVTQGVGMCLLAAWAACRVPSGVAAASMWWLAFEQAQVAACGISSYGIEVPVGQGLCTLRYGTWWYSPAAALVIYSTVRLYGSKHTNGRNSRRDPHSRRSDRQ